MSLLIGYFTVLRLACAAVRERELGLFRFFDVPQSCAIMALIIRRKGEREGGVGNALHAKVDLGYGCEHRERIGDAALLAELAFNFKSRIKVIKRIVVLGISEGFGTRCRIGSGGGSSSGRNGFLASARARARVRV